jgi:hypothetical protein
LAAMIKLPSELGWCNVRTKFQFSFHLRIRASWDFGTEADTRVIVTNDIASNSGLFALSTTNGQGADTCIE